MRSFTTWYLLLVGLLIGGAGTFFAWAHLNGNPSDTHKYPPLSVTPQGVISPHLVSGDEAELKDDEPVFGIVVNGQARAYQKLAFEIISPYHQLGRHVVNDLVGGQPVTIAHCDHVDCTRVFVGEPSDSPLNVGVKGWDTDKGMVILVSGNVYPLESPDIPLKELEFQQTSWASWYRAHPDTKVYLHSSSPIVNVN